MYTYTHTYIYIYMCVCMCNDYNVKMFTSGLRENDYPGNKTLPHTSTYMQLFIYFLLHFKEVHVCAQRNLILNAQEIGFVIWPFQLDCLYDSTCIQLLL